MALVLLTASVLSTVGVGAADMVTVLGPTGDITGDGIINTKDMTRLKRYLASGGDGSVTLTVESAADVTGDGTINTKDMSRLKRYLASGSDGSVTLSPSAIQVDTSTVFTMTEANGGYSVSAYTGDYTGVTIPATYGGKTVNTIAAGAFAGKDTLTGVTFEDPNCWQAGSTAIPAEFLTASAAANYLTGTYSSVVWTKTNHTYGDWVIVTPATATATGLQERACTGCGVTEEQVIPATGESGGQATPTGFSLSCLLGTADCYTYEGSTLTFTAIDAATTYSISGTFNGNIVVDVGDTYKFTLELQGCTLTCDSTNPIMVLTADEFELKAKNGYDNYIYDNRAAIDTTDTTLYSAAVYSFKDLEISGKGSLTVVSKNNDGIHTKDDLQVKNLALSVTCKDNALKGNDSVEILAANTTLISSMGDCIKTNNSELSTAGNQKGTVTITGGTHNLYAACDGIDAAFDAIINDATTVLNIYTDQYSEYSEEITAVSDSTYYLRYSSTAYKFSVKYSNNATGAYEWVNVSDTYETVTSSSTRPGGSGSTYYYYTFAKLSGYDKMTVYMYNSTQTQGQDTSYYACSATNTVNTNYDTVSVSYRNGSLSMSWTNYGTTSTAPGGMGGGMQEGNTDKGDHSTKGIKAFNEIVINDGTISIQAYDDAIHANNDAVLESGATPTGNVTINGGTVTVYSNDDGIHADGTLTVTNGTVNVTHAYEGMEGTYITISGGHVSVVSLDDGLNGGSTTGAATTVSGGTVYVYAGGDGIDSNSATSKGAILFSGGQTVVICNSNGNASIDSDGGYNHTGGSVLALMTTGGMTNEVTNGNTTGRTVKSSLSLTSGGYATVTVGGATVVTVKMPCSMTSYAVYLGSSSATIASATSATATLDANGVAWN